MNSRSTLSIFLALLVLISMNNIPIQTSHAETSPIIYSRISAISWPFTLFDSTNPSLVNYSTFQTEFTFQLINPTNTSITIANNCTILFALNASAELLDGEIATITDTNSCPYAITYDLLPGVNEYTYRKNIHFQEANLTSFPLGNYTLAYALLGEGDFEFYAYKLYLKITEDLVEISQEDGSFEITIVNDKEIDDLPNLTETPIAFITILLGLILAPLVVKYRKKKK